MVEQHERFNKEKDMENLIVFNSEKLRNTEDKIKEDGLEKFHVLSDFDKTLTTAEMVSVIAILRDGNYLTSDYSEKAHALFDRYHSIEVDPDIPLEEKKKAMHNWWNEHFQLLIKSGLSQDDIKKVVNSGKIKLRPGVLEFLDLLHNLQIPLVIMSASGLGTEAIRGFLEKEKKFYENIFIISNEFEWDKSGKAIGVREPIVHSLNKEEVLVKDASFFDNIKYRNNVLLLGDGIDDVGMVKGFDYKNLIKIGFLNKNIEERMNLYKDNFDIVITNDSDMNYVNVLIKELFA